MNLENQNFVGKSADEKDDHIFQCHDEIRELKAENTRFRTALEDLADDKGAAYWTAKEAQDIARQALNADGEPVE